MAKEKMKFTARKKNETFKWNGSPVEYMVVEREQILFFAWNAKNGARNYI